MRKMKRKIAFSAALIVSLALIVTTIPKVSGLIVKAGSNKQDPSIGTISYYATNFFDYESSQRSTETYNWLVDGKEYDTDEKLILFNQENYYVAEGQPKPSEYNSWIGQTKRKVVQGIVSDELNSSGTVTLSNDRVAVSGTNTVNLFDVTDTTFKGSYNFPFEKLENGYWQYDSDKNHVQMTGEVGENGLYNMLRQDVVSNIGFMPFNSINLDSGADENGFYQISGSKNFYFGMSMKLPFYMPEDGKVTTYSGSKEDMVFEFSGDDDMWVFVDGQLVLDLGGVHDAVEGKINFATGEVTTIGNHLDTETNKYSSDVTKVVEESSCLKSLTEGDHNIQVFFLERGGDKSNCKITFRLADDVVTPTTEVPTTAVPTEEVTVAPTTVVPTEEVTVAPTTAVPTEEVTVAPTTAVPTEEVTVAPTTAAVPTEEATVQPTQTPDVPVIPTEEVTIAPTTVVPTEEVTVAPTTVVPTEEVTIVPTTAVPTEKVTVNPTQAPDVPVTPTEEVTVEPTATVNTSTTQEPGVTATVKPTATTTTTPTKKPTTSVVANGNNLISGGGSNSVVIDDNSVAKSNLPQTGTVEEKVFYVVGALLIIIGLCLVFVPRKKTKKS